MTALKVGDTVEVSDCGIEGNYRGVGRVEGVSELWATVTIDNAWSGGNPWGRVKMEFETSRLTLVPDSHAVDVFVEELHGGPTMKPTNPKDAIGSDKLPLHLWPETATLTGSLAFLEGALKYGRNNWRDAGVRATIYIDAAKRHINAWAEGEDCAPDSEIPHLGHALACLAILVDAEAAGKLLDDRQYPGGYLELVEELTPHVARLKAKYDDKSPRHWTIQDAS